jgi:hypothetical protein
MDNANSFFAMGTGAWESFPLTLLSCLVHFFPKNVSKQNTLYTSNLTSA